METVLDKADSRGHTQYDGLESHHTLSFNNYYNPYRMNYGALRVLNDDRIAPGKGFETHPHKNMEILSIPLCGKLRHEDNYQNSQIITLGDIQIMSAGKGIYHSEMNDSKTEPVEFLQIWVIPEIQNTPPAYQIYDIRPYLQKNKLMPIISPDDDAPAKLQQQTWFYIGEVEANRKIEHHLHRLDSGVYIFLIEGEIEIESKIDVGNDVKIDNIGLSRRDGIWIYDTDSFNLETLKDSHILLIEVPM